MASHEYSGSHTLPGFARVRWFSLTLWLRIGLVVLTYYPTTHLYQRSQRIHGFAVAIWFTLLLRLRRSVEVHTSHGFAKVPRFILTIGLRNGFSVPILLQTISRTSYLEIGSPDAASCRFPRAMSISISISSTSVPDLTYIQPEGLSQ